MSDFNPTFTPKHKSWNYSNQSKEGYTEILVGTVVAIQKIQSTSFQTRQPEFWPDGNPKFNIRLALADPEGDLITFTFQPAGKAAREGKKRSVHIDLWHLTGDTDLINLIGKTIMITTQPGSYGANNPRPFEVSLVTDAGPYQYKEGELPEEFKTPEILIERPAIQQPQPQYQQPYQQPQYQQPPMQPNGFYAPPVAQQPMAQSMQQQYQQPQMNPMNPPMPQGMDPNVAAAMQQMGATNVQPMQAGTVYDEGIPF